MDSDGSPASGEVGNTHAHDRAVLIKEITAYAKRNCRWCYGDGVITMRKSNQEGVPVSHKIGFHSAQTICGCALKRFNDKCGDDVTLEGEVLYWVRNVPVLETIPETIPETIQQAAPYGTETITSVFVPESPK